MVSLLSTIGFLIMYAAFPIPLFPGFLTLDLSDIPALIGAILLGPGAGVAIEGIKNILHVLLVGSLFTAVPVGELANFAAGTILILVCTWLFRKKPSVHMLAAGMIAGTLMMAIIMAIANYYVIFPSYAMFLGFSVSQAVAAAQAANHGIHNLLTLIVYSVLPFNLLKGLLLTCVMIPVYARLRNYAGRTVRR